MNQIEEVAAPDARTVLIRWKNTYAGAAELQANDLQSLPRHLLEQPFQQLGPDAFVAHPFWTTDFVGSGAYRVTEWQRGVFLLSDAFDNFVLGKPRITRMKMVPIADPNTVLANLLAGEIHVAVSNSLPETEGFALKHEWEKRGGGGVVSMVPSASAASIRRTENQFSPDRANPRFITDVRVRRAFAHAVDKQGINDALFEGTGLMMDTIVPRNLAFFDELNRQVTKYPYDPRRADQLMTEAGLTKGSDGYYLGPSGERLNWDIKVLSGSQNEAIMHIMADSWRRVGFDMTETVYPVAQINDREARAGHGGHPNTTEPLRRQQSRLVVQPGFRPPGDPMGGHARPQRARPADDRDGHDLQRRLALHPDLRPPDRHPLSDQSHERGRWRARHPPLGMGFVGRRIADRGRLNC
jgi:ABC-type transport system substrate-binding protein